jgi:tricorn protease
MTSYDRAENFGLYLAVLKKGEPSPLLPESDEDKGVSNEPPGPRPDSDTPVPNRPERRSTPQAQATPPQQTETPETTGERPQADRAPRKPVIVQIDFEGLQQRIVSVAGVPERQYAQLKAGSAGTVFYLEAPAAGGGFGAGARGSTLYRYKLSDRKAATFMSNVAEYDISADGKKLLYRTPNPGGPGGGPQSAAARDVKPALFLVDADKQPPQAGQGKLDVTLRMLLDRKAEFAQIFNEGWRNQRDYLYVPNLHGADWPKMREMYGAMLPYAMHRADLNYLLDMMGAEIAIGHSYVRGGDMPEVPDSPGGLLGADFTVENGRYKITRIYDNESWNPDLRAPLAAPGVDVNVGDYILSINGVELRAPDNIYRLLDGTANRQTVLTVNGKPVMEGSRQVTVVPISNEQTLRTRAWVESNRRLVDKLSNSQLAYVYLPNTGQPGYTSFNRYYFAQQDRKGAVIDERFNGGGSAADYIVDVLGRDFDGYFNNVAGDRMPFTSPAAGIWGPKVMIVNEMAGSGGDLMPYMFKRRKIGLLVGKRTWGGLVHTADTPTFIDGGSMIAPRGGFFTREGKWAVENEGVAPDIDVENSPKAVIAGGDPQLERAVHEAMRQLKEKPVERLTQEPAPPTWGKRRTGS